MFRTISTTLMFVALATSSLSYAEVVDESWRQVYEFQSKMAAQGSSSAQFKLGEMYQHGRGVEKNYDTAIDWYNKAKSNGHAEAAKRIAMIQQAIQDDKQATQQAEAKRKAEEELARQQEADKKRAAAAEARRKEEERKKERAEQAKKAAAEEKSKQAKLSDEERARKIKEAQERAKAIAEQNRLKQQQQAEAALKEYRQAVVADKPAKNEPQSKTPQKYIDPFD